MSDFPSWIVAGVGLATAFLTTVTTTWRVSAMLSKRESKLQADLAAHQQANIESFARLREFVRDEDAATKHEFGTTVTTLREFTNKQFSDMAREQARLELEMGRALDNYVRKADFTAAVRELKEDMRGAIGEVRDQTRHDLELLRNDIRQQFDDLKQTLRPTNEP